MPFRRYESCRLRSAQGVPAYLAHHAADPSSAARHVTIRLRQFAFMSLLVVIVAAAETVVAATVPADDIVAKGNQVRQYLEQPGTPFPFTAEMKYFRDYADERLALYAEKPDTFANTYANELREPSSEEVEKHLATVPDANPWEVTRGLHIELLRQIRDSIDNIKQPSAFVKHYLEYAVAFAVAVSTPELAMEAEVVGEFGGAPATEVLVSLCRDYATAIRRLGGVPTTKTFGIDTIEGPLGFISDTYDQIDRVLSFFPWVVPIVEFTPGEAKPLAEGLLHFYTPLFLTTENLAINRRPVPKLPIQVLAHDLTHYTMIVLPRVIAMLMADDGKVPPYSRAAFAELTRLDLDLVAATRVRAKERRISEHHLYTAWATLLFEMKPFPGEDPRVTSVFARLAHPHTRKRVFDS